MTIVREQRPGLPLSNNLPWFESFHSTMAFPLFFPGMLQDAQSQHQEGNCQQKGKGIFPRPGQVERAIRANLQVPNQVLFPLPSVTCPILMSISCRNPSERGSESLKTQENIITWKLSRKEQWAQTMLVFHYGFCFCTDIRRSRKHRGSLCRGITLEGRNGFQRLSWTQWRQSYRNLWRHRWI